MPVQHPKWAEKKTPTALVHLTEAAATAGRIRRTRNQALRALCSRFVGRVRGLAYMHAVHDLTSPRCSGD